ncbi:hypothetical protein [Thiothrix subterranea]|uniref:Uncharacterized protein n=1 Tax=Thiothrix subterranea TaxID=2735563 RepID=A0AA51MLS5_9GAMM|nr:hypothetical protein [Thiothrix subterranea]MDQ5767936.1 hypothetical protein [Thiothrix subterranea]WML86605.1 hypothetical protein RCG00_20260 [Thiothrix subterranea]
MKHDETEAVLRGKVDIILDNIASLDEKTQIKDPQLKRIIETLKNLGKMYYDPYAVAVMPPIDDIITPREKN